MSIFKTKKSLLFLLFCFLFPSPLYAEELILKSFGHSKFLIEGGGHSILINPFKATGCAAGLNDSTIINSDFIIASSRLADEGYNPSNELMFVDPGTYKVNKLILNGIPIPHDRYEGRRYGMATVWSWNQGNSKIVHMGGAAGKISIKDQILISRPDILFISIGGGVKSYNGKEAALIVNMLKPQIVVPVHFLKDKKELQDCDFSSEDQFLDNVLDYQIKYVGENFKLNPEKNKRKTIYIVK